MDSACFVLSQVPALVLVNPATSLDQNAIKNAAPAMTLMPDWVYTAGSAKIMHAACVSWQSHQWTSGLVAGLVAFIPDAYQREQWWMKHGLGASTSVGGALYTVSEVWASGNKITNLLDQRILSWRFTNWLIPVGHGQRAGLVFIRPWRRRAVSDRGTDR